MSFEVLLDKIYTWVYTIIIEAEVINFMDTAKIFMNGKSQAIRLPKKFRFKDGEEILIKKIGESVILCPKDKAWENFLACEPIDDSVGEAIEEIRKDYVHIEREEV